MALSAATVWELRQDGNDNNGGGFVAGGSGTDRTLQAAAHASGTNLTVDATTNTDVAPDGHTPVSADVDNTIQITAGSGFTTGFYRIVSIQSGKWRLDRSPAATSTAGGTWALGGALATPGKVAGAAIAGNDVFIKYSATAYEITSTSSNVAGGRVAFSAGGADAANASRWVGYDSNRTVTNTDANRPTIKVADSGVSSITMLHFTGSYTVVRNLIVDGNAKTAIVGIDHNALYAGLVENCHAVNCTSYGIRHRPSGGGIYGSIVACSATGCSGTAAIEVSNAFALGLEAYANTTTGISLLGSPAARCLSYANTGGSSNGFALGGFQGAPVVHCTAYGNGGSGFLLSNSGSLGTRLDSCISYGHAAGYGFRCSSALDAVLGRANFAGSNASGNSSNLANLSVTALTADPFTNAGAGNFALNTTAGGGAACRAAGFPAAYPRGTTTSYADAGAAQHQDSGAADYPAVGDVQSGVTYGSGVYTGTFAAPAVGDVQSGVQYGAGGTEFTGTFVVPLESQVEDGVQYGAGGTEFEGELVTGGGAGDWTANEKAQIRYRLGIDGSTAEPVAQPTLPVDVVEVLGQPATTITSVTLDAGAVSGTPSAGSFTATGADLNTVSGAYSGMWLLLTSGTLKGVKRKVTLHTYASSTHTFAFTGATGALDAPFPSAPAATDTFVLG